MPGSKHGYVFPDTWGICGLNAARIHSDDFSRVYRRVSLFARNFTRNPVPQRRIGGGGGTDFQQLVQGSCLGCNVVISDKRLPGDTHCAPLAASTLRLPSVRRSACRPMFTHTHVTNRARHVPLVTVHYVANRDISLGHHPLTSGLRVSGHTCRLHNRELIIMIKNRFISYLDSLSSCSTNGDSKSLLVRISLS